VTAIAVIPARFASSRFPGKPLAKQTGRFLVQHVWERVRAAACLDRVIVATDDERIAEAVGSFGGEVMLTRADHQSGTDRVAEVCRDLECDLVVNVQGDEPEIEPATIRRLVELLEQDDRCPMATLACPFSGIPGSDPSDPDAVKVVVDLNGRALYFSRSLIPHPPDAAAASGASGAPLLHLGIYAYRRAFLLRLASWEPTPLEQLERLEQLRVLEHGHSIRVGVVARAAVGIDTPEDYAAFVQRYTTPEPARTPSTLE